VCVECAGEIPARRLEALPFALRCRACEEGREHEQGRARESAQRRDSRSFFPNSGS
jgi:RNA polymerase-binding transcription factor DksA